MGSKYADYLSGFLNLQIEHHIVPQMPMENYHLISNDLRSYAKKHNINYTELTFKEAFWNVIYGLKNTGLKELERRKKVM